MTYIRINLVSGTTEYGYSFEVDSFDEMDVWKKIEKLISDIKAEDND